MKQKSWLKVGMFSILGAVVIFVVVVLGLDMINQLLTNRIDMKIEAINRDSAINSVQKF